MAFEQLCFKALAGEQSLGNTSIEGEFLPTTAAPYVGEWERNDYWQQVRVTMAADVAGTLFFDFYDVDGTEPTPATTPTSTFPVAGFSYNGAGLNEYHGALKNLRWFRARFLPDADTATSFRVNTYFEAPSLANLPLSQPFSRDQDAVAVRSVSTGENPNGDFINATQSGPYTFVTPPSPLGVGGVWLSEAVNVSSWSDSIIVFGADAPSAIDGIVFEWSDDESFTNIRASSTDQFVTGDIARGLTLEIRHVLDWFRIRYTNGASAQTRFFVGLSLINTPVARFVTLNPPKTASTGQLSLSTSAQKVPLILANRRTVRIKNLSTSARVCYVGYTLGTTTGNGDELSPGEALDLDLDVITDIYAVVSTTVGGGTRISWTELG